jgi:hypothetical protein
MFRWLKRLKRLLIQPVEWTVEEELIFQDLIKNRRALRVFTRDRFRIRMFKSRESCESCRKNCHWFSFEFEESSKWKPILAMHQSKLELVQQAIDEVKAFIAE